MHAWMANQNTRLDLLHISNSYIYNVKGAVSKRFGGRGKRVEGLEMEKEGGGCRRYLKRRGNKRDERFCHSLCTYASEYKQDQQLSQNVM